MVNQFFKIEIFCPLNYLKILKTENNFIILYATFKIQPHYVPNYFLKNLQNFNGNTKSPENKFDNIIPCTCTLVGTVNQEARTVCEWCMEQVALEPECLANCWKSHLCKVNPTVPWAYHIHTMAYHIQPQLFATWKCNQLQLVWNRNFVVLFLFSFLLLLHQSQQNVNNLLISLLYFYNRWLTWSGMPYDIIRGSPSNLEGSIT